MSGRQVTWEIVYGRFFAPAFDRSDSELWQLPTFTLTNHSLFIRTYCSEIALLRTFFGVSLLLIPAGQA